MALGIRSGSCARRCQLLRMVRQDEPGPTQQAGHGLRAGADEQDTERRAFRIGEAPSDAVIADDLGSHEVGQHVVPRYALPFLDLLTDVVVQPRPRLQGRLIGHANAGFQVEQTVDVVADVSRSDGGTPSSVAMTVAGRRAPKSCDVVEAVPTLLNIEETCAERSDFVLELCDPARRERLRHQTAQGGVLRRVEEDHHALALGLLGHGFQARWNAPSCSAAGPGGLARRPRTDSGPKSRIPRCSTPAPRRGGASTPDAGHP